MPSTSCKESFKRAVKVGGVYLCYSPMSRREVENLLRRTRYSFCKHSFAKIRSGLMDGILELIAEDPNIPCIKEKIIWIDETLECFLKDYHFTPREAAKCIRLIWIN